MYVYVVCAYVKVGTESRGWYYNTVSTAEHDCGMRHRRNPLPLRCRVATNRAPSYYDSLTGSPIALEWQTTSTSAGLGLRNGHVGAHGHEHEQITSAPAEVQVARAGPGGSRLVKPKPAVRTLWEEEEEEEEEKQGEERGGNDDTVEVDDMERIVAFVRRMAFNVSSVGRRFYSSPFQAPRIPSQKVET